MSYKGSGSPGRSTSGRSNQPQRSDNVEQTEEVEDEGNQIAEFEMTPEERRIFRATGVRPDRNTRPPPPRQANPRPAPLTLPTAAELQDQANVMGARFDAWFSEAVADILRNSVRRVLDDASDHNGADEELRQVMHDHFYNMPQNTRPTERFIVNSALHWMRVTGREDSRQAVLALAQADWDYGVAVQENLGVPVSFGTSAFESVRRLIDFTGVTPSEAMSALSRANWDYRLAAEAIAEKGDEPQAGEDSGSELSELSAQGDLPAEMKALLKLNHNIDREPLKKGQRDDSKLTITIKHPGGKADVLYNYSKKENGTVDFNSAKVVREVNKWRNQIFRRNFGIVRPARIKFSDVEKQWLIDVHKEFKKQRAAAGQILDWSKMGWDKITKDFNAKFEGQILPGNKNRQPQRTTNSLRTERNRIKAITDMTGITPRDQKKVPEESSEDEDEPQDQSE